MRRSHDTPTSELGRVWPYQTASVKAGLSRAVHLRLLLRARRPGLVATQFLPYSTSEQAIRAGEEDFI